MIGVVDYGAGNMFSVINALKYLKQSYITADNIQVLSGCDRIILPGVGAFKDAVNKLKKLQLFEYLKQQRGGKPFLGICLGMQLLFEKGYEFGETEGLGLICGSVRHLKVPYKIPHMGWNSLVFNKQSPLLHGVKEESYVYFVHSFVAEAQNPDIAAYCEYGVQIPALVQKENVFGAQFHPEKSGSIGLKILENFCLL